jgi:hypothetical protein
MSSNVSVESREGPGAGARGAVAVGEGVMAGLIGAAVVAGWFLVLDLILGRLLFTPGALGSALFLGVESPDAVQITAGTVLGYTVIHVGVFLLAGIAFATAVRQAERQTAVLMGVMLFFVATVTFGVGAMAILASWVLAELTWWGIAIGNLLAAGAMAAFLWMRHPNLAHRVSHAEERGAAEEGMAGPGEADRRPSPGRAQHYRPRGPSTPEGGEPA